jgi:hypothetical protein
MNELFDYEYLYMRNAQLTTINVVVPFPVLRVIDFSANELQSLEFLSHMPLLKHVFLSSNHIEDFDTLPPLQNLESLNLTHNSISSFSNLPSLPKLRVLNLSSNNIENYQDFPALTNLETFNILNNTICDMKEFEEITIGMNLKLVVLNGENVTEEQREKGFTYRGSVAMASRAGMYIKKEEIDVDVKERADEYFREYQINLTKSSPVHLIHLCIQGNSSEGSPTQFSPIFKLVDDKYTVHVASHMAIHRFESDNKEITLTLNNLPVEIPLDKLEDNLYSVTLVLPIGDYNVKYKKDGVVQKEEMIHVEKSNISTNIGNKELYLHARWYKTNNGLIYSDIESSVNDIIYTPTLDDHQYSLKADISAYSNSTHTQKYFTVYDISDSKIQVGVPVCNKLDILGTFRENSILSVQYEYAGGKEGKSRIRWYGPSNRVVDGYEYEIGLDDVGHQIRVECIPVRKDGVEGEPFSVNSPYIQAGEPEIKNIQVIGELYQDGRVSIDYAFSGGHEGTPKIQWYKSKGTKIFEPIEGANSKELDVTIDYVNRRLKVVVVPVNSNDNEGVPVEFVTEKVGAAKPKITQISLDESNLEQDGSITVTSDYHGGVEGNSTIEWFKINANSSNNRQKIVGATLATYTIRDDDIGYYIEVQKTPVRADGVAGKSVSVKSTIPVQPGKPQALSLTLSGAFEQDETVKVSTQYKGGNEGNSLIHWFRDYDQISQYDGKRQIVLGLEDIGHRIRVRYTPVRSDGTSGEYIEQASALVKAAQPRMKDVKLSYPLAKEGITAVGSASFYGGIEKYRNHKWIRVTPDNEQQVEIEGENQETYTFQAKDIGCKIIYQVQSVRDDVAAEWTKSLPTEPIEANKPVVKSVEINGECKQDGALHMEISGEFLSPEKSKYRWTRVVSDNEEIDLSVHTQSYNITLDDLGKKLRCYVVPMRDIDIDIATEEVHATSDTILAEVPRATSCTIEGQAEEGKALECHTQYYGGNEGTSVYKWFRVKSNSDKTPLESNDGKLKYQVTLEDVNSIIRFEYTPVREDGVSGETVSVDSDTVKAAFPTIYDLIITGNASEDSKLSASGRYYGGIEGGSMKRWKRLDGVNNVTVAVETSEYAIQAADVGYKISFEYTPIRNDGIKGKVVQVQTEVVEAKPPSVTNVKLNGTGAMSSELSVSGNYYGGIEGKSVFTWYFATSRDSNYTAIPGATTNRLLLNADYAGLQLKAQYTPVRSDGVKGSPVDCNTTIKVSLDTNTGQMIKSVLSTGVMEYTLTDVNKESVVLSFSKKSKNLYVKNATTNKTVKKIQWSDVAEIKADPSNDKAFSISTRNGGSIFFATTNTKLRDSFIILMRVVYAVSNEILSVPMFGQAFSTAWKKSKNIGQEYAALSNLPIPDLPSEANNNPELFKVARAVIAFRRGH